MNCKFFCPWHTTSVNEFYSALISKCTCFIVACFLRLIVNCQFFCPWHIQLYNELLIDSAVGHAINIVPLMQATGMDNSIDM